MRIGDALYFLCSDCIYFLLIKENLEPGSYGYQVPNCTLSKRNRDKKEYLITLV